MDLSVCNPWKTCAVDQWEQSLGLSCTSPQESGVSVLGEGEEGLQDSFTSRGIQAVCLCKMGQGPWESI